MEDIANILTEAGYGVSDGETATRQAILMASDSSTKTLCSGYRCFPNGDMCLGCTDCEENGNDSNNS